MRRFCVKYSGDLFDIDNESIWDDLSWDDSIWSSSKLFLSGLSFTTPKSVLRVPSPLYGIFSTDSYPGALISILDTLEASSGGFIGKEFFCELI